jgi:hypothetical protein
LAPQFKANQFADRRWNCISDLTVSGSVISNYSNIAGKRLQPAHFLDRE